jgi:protein-S-isoprenylcysteine O-methyltransferase Ste14
MIHRKPIEGSTFNMVGPYKYFRNPMYGVGYVGAYGFGIVHRSPLCLGLAAIMHLGVWYFNSNVEQKWVNRIYGDGEVKKSEKTE